MDSIPMEALPYFFELVKHHALLSAIISTGSFPDFNNVQMQHSVWSDKVIELRDLHLSEEERFHTVMVTLGDSSIRVEFKTEDPKYFQNSKYYFGVDGVVQNKNPYYINDSLIRTKVKNLGEFELFNKYASVVVRQYSPSNYYVSLNITALRKHKDEEPAFFVEEFPSHKNIILLFKPNEITLVKEYSPDSNVPAMHIRVKDKDHPVLKYYRHNASLLYEGEMYLNNQIPRINPMKVERLEFASTKDHEGDECYQLEVIQSPQIRSNGGKYISYTSEPASIQYYAIDGIIMTKDQLKQKNIDIQDGYRLLKTVFGKDAYLEFGQKHYSSGVAVYVKE